MQKLCNSCNKCARECPSGPFPREEGDVQRYEIWKADTGKSPSIDENLGGAMCGRCMKTAVNLEGL